MSPDPPRRAERPDGSCELVGPVELSRRLTDLLWLGDGERGDWLEVQEPPSGQLVNWWLHLLVIVDAQLDNQPDHRPDWVALRVWLLRHAKSRDIFTDVESAQKMADFVAMTRQTYPELAALLPSADEVAHACLTAIPVDLDEVALVEKHQDLRRLDRTRMRQSRQAKNLLNAAEQHLDHIEDEQLADQLRQWLAVKPRLV